jgi:hypothetical protein
MPGPNYSRQLGKFVSLRKGLARIEARLLVIAPLEAAEKARRQQREAGEAASFQQGIRNLSSEVQSLRRAGRLHRTHFNPFEVIERKRCEQTHSNILAWLLNPDEAHGLGDTFLRSFVTRVFSAELGTTEGALVVREGRFNNGQCDIVVKNDDWVVVIENKLYAPEWNDQTVRYAQHWRTAPGRRIFFAFLTRDGSRARSNRFKPVTYATVRDLLATLKPSPDSAPFIEQFIDHLWFAGGRVW